MTVVRMLLNSWATLEARAPMLLRRWACSSCCRSVSVSVFCTITSSPSMECLQSLEGRAFGRARAPGPHDQGSDMVSAAARKRLDRKSLHFKLLSRENNVISAGADGFETRVTKQTKI